MLIPMANGMVAIIDDDDWPIVSQYTWRAYRSRSGNWYARGRFNGSRRQKSIFLHRLILGSQAGPQIDHANNNGMDNRRENLRPCTGTQNNANRRSTGGSSRFKGVCKRGARWEAKIKCQGKTDHLGTFDDEQDAARAYDKAAKERFGDFARLNFALA